MGIFKRKKQNEKSVQENAQLEDFSLQEQETELQGKNNTNVIETLAFKKQKRKSSRFSHCPYEMHLCKNSTHKPRIKL